MKIPGGVGERRRVARDGDSRKATSTEIIAGEEVSGGPGGYQRPGIDPNGIRKEWRPGGLKDGSFGFETVFGIAIRIVGITVTIQSVASLVVGCIVGYQPRAGHPPGRSGVGFELVR